MTKLSHPRAGYNQLWRSDAYDSLESLEAIFENPRAHTGKGYRSTDQSVRGCVECGVQKKRKDFSKNQWRKGPNLCKCQDCTQGTTSSQPTASGGQGREGEEMPISRDYITCDASGCGRTNPSLRCERCLLMYYCSEACQSQHAREHAPDCRPIDGMRALTAQYQEPNPDNMRGWARVTEISGKRSFKAILAQAQYIHEADGNLDMAIELYKELLMKNLNQGSGTPVEWHQLGMGLSRCCYELGEYDKAIHSGTAALEMNRHFPQAHKYVALAQKASGDLEAAKATMMRAVLYETSWDDRNIEANKDLLWQIMN